MNFSKEKIESLNRIMYMYYLLPILMLVAGCQYLPHLADDIEEIATDTAIKIEVSRETFLKETDLQITINVQNKDEQKPAVAPMQSK